MSEFQAKFGLIYPNMTKLLEKTNHAREINLFCVTDVFYRDFVSSEPTSIQNRVHVNKTGEVHFVYARKRRFVRNSARDMEKAQHKGGPKLEA